MPVLSMAPVTAAHQPVHFTVHVQLYILSYVPVQSSLLLRFNIVAFFVFKIVF